MQRILFRVDANPDIALGHLKRCVSLAEGLREKGVEPLFLTFDTESSRALLANYTFQSGFLDTPVNTADDTDKTLSFMKDNNLDSVIFDSYSVTKEYLDTFSHQALNVICIDDIADRPLPCDMIINGGLGAETLDYEAGIKLLGIRYCILSRPFWNYSNIGKKKGIHNILITMGGIDHYGFSEKSMQILDRLPQDFKITMVIGAYYENLDTIKAMAQEVKKDVELIIDQNDLYPYMQKCDMAISAGGFTLYELAALRKPVIGLGLWENQYRNVGALDKMGVILGLKYMDDDSFHHSFESTVSRLTGDQDLRNGLAEKAGELFDGQGALRTASNIKKFLEHI